MNDMKNKENRTLRIDHDIKVQATKLFKSLGLDMRTATGIFYRQTLQHHGLPFDVKIEKPNIETYAAMEYATKRRDLNDPFNSVEELMELLDDSIGLYCRK